MSKERKKQKENYEEILEKLCELDGFLRGHFKQSYHDYKPTINIVKALVKEKIENE